MMNGDLLLCSDYIIKHNNSILVKTEDGLSQWEYSEVDLISELRPLPISSFIGSGKESLYLEYVRQVCTVKETFEKTDIDLLSQRRIPVR